MMRAIGESPHILRRSAASEGSVAFTSAPETGAGRSEGDAEGAKSIELDG